MSFEVRKLKKNEWTTAMALAWRTFLAFESEEYGPEGVTNFYKFVTSPLLEKMFLQGDYLAVGAFQGDELVGICGLRSGTFLSILFVDERYHHRGIATALVGYIVQYLSENIGRGTMTVHSSPYAVEFYHHLGFTDDGSQVTENGIIYTPMKMDF